MFRREFAIPGIRKRFLDAINSREMTQRELEERIEEGMARIARRQPEIDYKKFPLNSNQVHLTPRMLVPETTVDFGGPLSNKGILRHLFLGDIDLYPFKPHNLGANAYDVPLGEMFWKFDHVNGNSSGKLNIHNPLSSKNHLEVDKKELVCAETLASLHIDHIDGVRQDDKVFLLPPAQMVLGHTDDVIWNKACVSTISARSSIGRNFITICEDSFLINYGFKGRVTLEIRSKINEGSHIPLVVGLNYAQVQFYLVEPPLVYSEGRYSDPRDVVDIYNNWDPNVMLPTLWKDLNKR